MPFLGTAAPDPGTDAADGTRAARAWHEADPTQDGDAGLPAAEPAPAARNGPPLGAAPPEPARSWRAGDDVMHAEFGHGWVQGAGHGRVTVRFETRSTGPGRARTLAADDPALRPAGPLASLA